jgi:transcriptional regulator with GAF, ATPase, and Fis domain
VKGANMPYPFKLKKLATERSITERALLVDAIETHTSYRKAALALGVSEGAIRAAVKRLGIQIAHGKMKVMR